MFMLTNRGERFIDIFVREGNKLLLLLLLLYTEVNYGIPLEICFQAQLSIGIKCCSMSVFAMDFLKIISFN